MTRLRLYRSFRVLFGAILISSCSDSALLNPTAPADAAASSSALASSKGHGSVGQTSGPDLELKALWWKKQHKASVRVSQTIDPSGGTISIPSTGLTIVFPAGAVGAPLTITVTADDKYVAYKMEPSGTRFAQDVVVTQQLGLTQLGGSPLRGQIFAAYIADDNVKLSGKVPVLELEQSTTTLSPVTGLPEAQVWVIRHFSRYMLASG
jgi:hypothetical protein